MDGHDEAFNTIVKQYYPKILSYCNYILGYNRSAAEDCTQDVFVILYNNMGKLRDYDKIGGWIYKTAANLTKQYAASIRKERKHTIKLPSFMDEDELSLPMTEALTYGESVDTRMEDEDQISVWADQILSNLKKDEQDIWRLSFREKKTIREVADVLQISESAAKSRINRLRHKITSIVRDMLKEKD
jgi:RNA polymerase sigma-70 factor (ECF subfamily)